eukprot:g20887.t1
MVDLDACTGPGRALKRSARLSDISKNREESARDAAKMRRKRGVYRKSCTAPGCARTAPGCARTAPGCARNATFGFEGSAGLRRRERCGIHKVSGMVDLATLAESAKLAEAGRAQTSLRTRTQTHDTGGSGRGSSGETTEGDEDWEDDDGDSDSDYEDTAWAKRCQNLPKRCPSKRKRAVWSEGEEEEEEEEEEEDSVGIKRSTRTGGLDAATRDGQPLARKKPRGGAGGGTAVLAGQSGGDGGSGVPGGGGVGVDGDSPGVDVDGVGFDFAPMSKGGDDWWPAVDGVGGVESGGGGGEAGAGWQVRVGVSDEAYSEVYEYSPELWCHQDTSPTVEARTRGKACPRVAMVAVKHELGGEAAVKQEATETITCGQQPSASFDQSTRWSSHAGVGDVAGAVDVKPDLIEAKGIAWTEGWREAEGGHVAAGAGAGVDERPRWKWMRQAEAKEQVTGGSGEEKRCCYQGCRNAPRIGVYKLEGVNMELTWSSARSTRCRGCRRQCEGPRQEGVHFHQEGSLRHLTSSKSGVNGAQGGRRSRELALACFDP